MSGRCFVGRGFILLNLAYAARKSARNSKYDLTFKVHNDFCLLQNGNVCWHYIGIVFKYGPDDRLLHSVSDRLDGHVTAPLGLDLNAAHNNQ